MVQTEKLIIMTKEEYISLSINYNVLAYVSKGIIESSPTGIVKLLSFTTINKGIIGYQLHPSKGIDVCGCSHVCKTKLILRPLEDLLKDQDKEDSFFWRFEEFACNTRDAASMYDHSGLNDINWLQEPFEIVMWLIKEHVDILGLIKNKEAIDVNTLDHNPYI